MRFNERQCNQFRLAYMAVVGDGLNYAVGLSRLGSVLTVIAVIGINFGFIM
jgi:hypothetical protein